MRKEFLTGFHGSAGEAIVTVDKAVFWTDGRYHVQADDQLDCNWILMKQGEYDVSIIMNAFILVNMFMNIFYYIDIYKKSALIHLNIYKFAQDFL